MTWTSKKIRELRIGLGWSAAQLSRRLGQPVSVVLDWESSQKVPDASSVQQLDQLQFYCDDCLRYTLEAPHAENEMKSKGLEQVTRKDLTDSIED